MSADGTPKGEQVILRMPAETTEYHPESVLASASLTPTIGIEEAAKLLRCHPDTVRKMAKAGELPAAKVGRAWLFLRDELIQWLKARTAAGTAKRPDPMHLPSSILAARLDAETARRTVVLPKISDRRGG